MKKIFTLVFSVCLLTVAFGQDGHSNGDYSSRNGQANQSWYQGDRQNHTNDQRYQATPYSNSDNWKYQSNDQINEHGYGNEVKNRDDFRNRDDMRSRFDGRRFDRGRYSRYSKTNKKKPGLQIFFSFGSHH